MKHLSMITLIGAWNLSTINSARSEI